MIGKNEMENDTVSVRSRDEGDIGSMSVADFLVRIDKEHPSTIKNNTAAQEFY